MHLAWRAFACWEHKYGGGENYVLWVSVDRTVVIWLWESIWREGGGVVGWVLISWNNTFYLESITQKVKILLVSSFKWYFSPRSMLSTGCMSWSLKKQMLLCTLSSGCVTFLYRTTWFSCLYMFVLLHAVKSNDRRMHTGISLYYGSKSAARPSQTNDIQTILCMSSYGKGGGVSMTWGYLLPLQHSPAIRATDKIRQKKKKKSLA